jgi:hypothetical protein
MRRCAVPALLLHIPAMEFKRRARPEDSKNRVSDALRKAWTPDFIRDVVHEWRRLMGISGVQLVGIFSRSKGELGVDIDLVTLSVHFFNTPRLSIQLSPDLLPDIHVLLSSNQPIFSPTDWRFATRFYEQALLSDHETEFGTLMAAVLTQRNAVFEPAGGPEGKIWADIWKTHYREFLYINANLANIMTASSDGHFGMFIGKIVALISTHISFAAIDRWMETTVAVEWTFSVPKHIKFCSLLESLMLRTQSMLYPVTRKPCYDAAHVSGVTVLVPRQKPARFVMANVDKAICLFTMLVDTISRAALDSLPPDSIPECILRTWEHLPFLFLPADNSVV